jgi:predicted peptidase
MRLLALLLLGLCPFYLLAQGLDDYEFRQFLRPAGDTINYRILFPPGYEQSQAQYPLVLFLHGAGERGDDNELQLVHGARLFLDSIERYPAIVVFPQCPEDSYWVRLEAEGQIPNRTLVFPFYETPAPPLQKVMDLLDILLLTERVDESRLYLGGLSMGGFGTFDLLARRPNTFAAAFPICGGGNSLLAPLYAGHTRMWIFHGTKDDVVPAELSRRMYRALQAAGAQVQYTEYPEANHDSWTPAFAEPGFLRWLFQK